MKHFELQEAASIVEHINGMMLLFSATDKTGKILTEYIQHLIIELQDQDLIDEAIEKSGEEDIDFQPQIDFLKYLLSAIEKLEHPSDPIDKTSN